VAYFCQSRWIWSCRRTHYRAGFYRLLKKSRLGVISCPQRLFLTPPSPGLFTAFGLHREEGRGFCGLPMDPGIFFLCTGCRSKCIDPSLRTRPGPQGKRAGRRRRVLRSG
jgi:hypothetical protein